MKLSRHGLRLIILEQLRMVRKNHSGWQGWISEDEEDIAQEEDPESNLDEAWGGSKLGPGSGRIWVAGRSITGPSDIGKHAWIMIKEPGDPSNPIISLSGKSGVGFEAGAISALIRKGLRGEARDVTADEVVDGLAKAYHSGTPLRQELLDALESTSWGPLRKKVNYDADTVSSATDLWEITPDNQTDVKTAIADILSAYENYKETTPYDPLPGIASSNSSSRNSNSFARTLLDVARSGRARNMPSLSGFNQDQYPGWHLAVQGMTPTLPTNITESFFVETMAGRDNIKDIIHDMVMLEVQQISLNPASNDDFETTAGTPKPVLQGRLCGQRNRKEATNAFMRQKGIVSGEYFITCIEDTGKIKSGLAGIDPDLNNPPYPRQFRIQKGGKKCWSCVANKDEGSSEQDLTFPEDELPPGTESV